MISFKIPQKDLRLFLVALNMNFNLSEPNYIFQVGNSFEIVFTKRVDPLAISQIDVFIEKLWNIESPKHSLVCDVDPETMTWKRDIKEGTEAFVCQSCNEKILMHKNKKG